jgi:futalosine hydrolase
VEATSIVAADLGVASPDGFHSVSELGFGTDEIAATTLGVPGAIHGPIFTVSTVTGSEQRAAELEARGGVAEAMEGFGVAAAAVEFGVPVSEIRAISNAVGLRERDRWDIPGALAALAAAAQTVLKNGR